MAERPVTKTAKGPDGEITALCNDEAWWSPRSRDDAINDIESGEHTYYVAWTYGQTEVRVAMNDTRKYLRTDKDSRPRNNLADLPDCD